MSLRNIENYPEALIRQYKELISSAVLESETEQRTQLSIGKLNAKLKVICKAASYDGLTEDVMNQLIQESVPAKPMTRAA